MLMAVLLTPGRICEASTVGFRVNPGGKQQVLHRDDKYGSLPLLAKTQLFFWLTGSIFFK